MVACIHEYLHAQKQKTTGAGVFPHSFIIFILFVLVFTLLSKDNKSFPQRLPLLRLLPASIFPSPSLCLHLALDSPARRSSSLSAFLSFPTTLLCFLPLSSAPSFLFLCSIPHIPVGLLRGRTPLAGQGQTLLQCSLSLSLFLSLYHSSGITDSTSPFI